MATINQQLESITKVIDDILAPMRSLKAARVRVIDESFGEPTGNDKVARLMEVFSGYAQGKKEIILVTKDLGLDSTSTEILLGVPVAHGLLYRKFGEVSQEGLRRTTLPEIAEKMIEESPLARTLQQGLMVIVDEDIKNGVVKFDDGIVGLRHHVNNYLNRELTGEWQKTLVARSPFTAALDVISNGLQKDVQAPEKASFANKRAPRVIV